MCLCPYCERIGIRPTTGPRVVLPRAFSYQGVAAIIENGVSRDILKAGMASLAAALASQDEAYRLSAENIAMLIRLVGREPFVERGLL
jgi:hypothetical protein